MLLRGDKATPNQKHLIAITAKAQSLEAFIDLDGKMQPLVDPTPSPERRAARRSTTPAPRQPRPRDCPAATPARRTRSHARATTPATTTPPTTDGGH